MSALQRRARRPKMKRWVLGLDPATETNLALRSKAHGVSRPVFVRSLINGHRPGSVAGSEAARADQWWDSRKPDRRISIWRNHSAISQDTVTLAGSGQLSIEDAFDTAGESQ